MKNGLLKKGSFVKCGDSVYMLMGILDSGYEDKDSFAGIKIRNNKGRFKYSSKKIFSISQITKKSDLRWVEILETVTVDTRDQQILNEFIDYVNNTNIKFEGKFYEFKHNKETYSYFSNKRIVNGNFKKFKDHSRKV